MKKHLLLKAFILLFFSVTSIAGFSQHISKSDLQFLQQREDSLKTHALKIIQGINAEDRFKSDSIFTKILVRALKIPNSFYYPFDSLITISKLYPPDSTFRIFTWQMVINENVIRQHGAIQMRTADGSLKLFPLIDKSDVTTSIKDTVADNKGWIGAVYYKIIQNKECNDVYTLLGYDENNIRSTKKIIEVLTFQNGVPVFGGRYFNLLKDGLTAPRASRFIMEFKKDAGARLAYDDDLRMIIVEHLESETKEPNKKWTYIPDGDYEGFKWENCAWVHIEKVFNYITPLGQAPTPSPVRDDKGNFTKEELKGNFSEEVKPAPKRN